MNDQRTYNSVNQASGRAAGSKMGNFLSGGVCVCVCGGGGGLCDLPVGYQLQVFACSCAVTAPPHLTVTWVSVCAHVCVCECVNCNCQREQLQEKDGGWIHNDICLPYLFFFSFFFFSTVGLHENVYTNITHKLTVTHTHGVRFDCTQQVIHYCFHESMGKCTPMMYGHRSCLHKRVWVNAHPRCMATNVALAMDYGWMHTHNVRQRMLPSQQNMGNAHPRHTATDVAFIKSKGVCTLTTYFRRCTAKVKMHYVIQFWIFLRTINAWFEQSMERGLFFVLKMPWW